MKPTVDYTLYLVTDRPTAHGCDLLDVVAAAVAGGATVVQLREKRSTTRACVALARKMKDMLDPLGVPLIIDDRVDVALAIGAAGVHLGCDDMDYADARRLLGQKAIIGLTANSMEDILAAEALDADYLGVGPIFFTTTKDNPAPPWGVVGFAGARKASRHRLVAIGGVTAATAAELAAAGADGIAVVAAIIEAEKPREAAQNLRRAMLAPRSAEEVTSLSEIIDNTP